MQPILKTAAVRPGHEATTRLKRSRIRQIIESHAFRTAYQPLFSLADNRIEGLECLTRFDVEPYQSPDQWFQEADEVGLGLELEFDTMAAALGGLRAIPCSDYLALNVSPEALCDFRLATVLSAVDLRQIVLELTEHTRIDDYASIVRALRPLRERGVRVAVDDVGAGYANMRHILSLQPDLMKLDVSLTKDIDRCPARVALLTGLVHFGRAIGARTVAEGVETVLQLRTLRTLGVDAVQGYLFGHPV
ncbi:EAL domain-containing protein [Aureimonas sp. AU12]|uniref:EAL domain-containing protein n=1 Tax=Aureimonas sp. AU12 TaxID=1638161 RepID=UPI0007830160|nr:EAL domain-containing protein [Aureimonas sp. AU12]